MAAMCSRSKAWTEMLKFTAQAAWMARVRVERRVERWVGERPRVGRWREEGRAVSLEREEGVGERPRVERLVRVRERAVEGVGARTRV